MNHNQKSNCPFLENHGRQNSGSRCPHRGSNSNFHGKKENELLALVSALGDMFELLMKQLGAMGNQGACKMGNCSSCNCGCSCGESTNPMFECPHLEEVHANADMNSACPFLAAHSPMFECPHLEEVHANADMNSACPFLAAHGQSQCECADCKCNPCQCGSGSDCGNGGCPV